MLPTIETTPRMRKQIGKAIKKARIDADITQQNLAERAEISTSYLSQIERGVREMSHIVFNSIAASLGVKVSRLLEDAQSDEEPDPRLAMLIKISKAMEALEKEGLHKAS